jgi:hypothetical protein
MVIDEEPPLERNDPLLAFATNQYAVSGLGRVLPEHEDQEPADLVVAHLPPIPILNAREQVGANRLGFSF